MSTERAGIPANSAVAQQVHHAEQTAQRAEADAPPSALLKPRLDSTPLPAVGKAIRCVLRPYPIDDADPRLSTVRVAVVLIGAVAVVSASVFVLRRAR